MELWAVFQDKQGNLECGEVDLTRRNFVKHIPGQPRQTDFWGRQTRPADPARFDYRTLPDHDTRLFRDLARDGYAFDPNLRFCQNVGIRRQVISYIVDKRQAEKLRRLLAQISDAEALHLDIFQRDQITRLKTAILDDLVFNAVLMDNRERLKWQGDL